jgi:hypothetical protein
VIDAWKNWENGAILSSGPIQLKFQTFFNQLIPDALILENLLKNNDNWFNIMFKTNNL